MKKDNFWKNKNVFITGVAGFVGSNLAKNLVENGANVIGLTKNKRTTLNDKFDLSITKLMVLLDKK